MWAVKRIHFIQLIELGFDLLLRYPLSNRSHQFDILEENEHKKGEENMDYTQLEKELENYYETKTFIVYQIGDYKLAITDIPIYINLNDFTDSIMLDISQEIIGDFMIIYCGDMTSDQIVKYEEIEDIFISEPQDEENGLDLKHDARCGKSAIH